jgi:hypothetical protein
LWEDFEEEFKNEVQKEKEREMKEKEEAKQKQEESEIKKASLLESIRQKLTKEELKAIGMRK